MSTKPNLPIKKRGDKLTAEELNKIVDYFTKKLEEDNLPVVSDGKSAYEIAVELGFEGTEEEWLNSLSPSRYFDSNVFTGEGTSEADKVTLKDGAVNEIHLSEEVNQKLNNQGGEGHDGITPHIGENGNWYLGETDTGVKAEGEDGYTPQKGTDYSDGEDGREVEFQKSTTHIQWRYIGNADWVDLVALDDIKGDPGDSVLQPETLDYYNRIIEAGGSIDSATLNAVDKFIVRGKVSGWWNSRKIIYAPLGSDFEAMKVPIFSVTDFDFYNFVAADYKQGRGIVLTSNSNKYIDLNFIPENNGITSQNMSLGVAVSEDVQPTTFGRIMGCIIEASTSDDHPFISLQEDTYGYRDIKFQPNFGGEGSAFIGRIGGGTFSSFINGVKQKQGSATITKPFNSNLNLFRSGRGNGMQYATGGLGAFWIGTDLTNEQAQDFTNDLTELMAATRDIYKKYPLIAFGDSITAGSGLSANTAYREKWSKLLANKLGLREYSTAQGSSQTVLDHSGSSTISAVNRYGPIKNIIGTVAIMYGTNDIGFSTASNYQSALNTIISEITKTNHKVIVVGLPYKSSSTTEAQLIEFSAANAAAAKTNKVPFADTYRAMLDTGNPSSLLTDGVHPNALGAKLIAETAYVAFLGRLVRKPTLDFPSIPSGASADLTVTVLNAEIGMSVSRSLPPTLEAGLIADAFVSADDTVTVRLTNITGETIDPAPGKYTITVFLNY